MNLLLEAGADVNTQKGILRKAVDYNNDKCLDLLLKVGADVNKAGCDGKTALAFSAKSGKLKCLELLIKAGADVNTKTLDGCSVLMIAAEHQQTQCVESLLHAGALVNILLGYFNALTHYIIIRDQVEHETQP